MDASYKQYLDGLSVEAQYEIADGDPARGVDLCLELVERWTGLQDVDGERVLVWRGFLGRALTEARRYAEAEQVLSDLVVDRTRIEGPDAPGTLVARGNLARAVSLGGRPREGILLAERLIEDRMRLLGPDHRATFDARGHLAHFHAQAGDPATAADLFRALLADRERVLGPDHDDTVITAANLVVMESRATGARQAIDDLRDEIDEIERDLGPEHQFALDAKALLAEQLLRDDEPFEAYEVVRQVVDGRRALYGPDDPRTFSAEVTRARCLTALRMRTEAIASLVDLVERADTAGLTGDVHALAARADLLWILVEWYAKSRAPEDALDVIRAHLAVLTEAASRLEPDTYPRQIADDVTEFLAAVDSGEWFEDDDEVSR